MSIPVEDKIKELLGPLLDERSMFLVDIELKQSGQNEVWIYLDAEDRGVNLDECAEVSRELGFLMDAHDLFEIKYRLNVSSPGLSRPLSDHRQYKKNIGRFVKVKTRTPEDGFSKLEGLLTEVLDEAIHIKNDDGSTTMVPRSDIYETKIIPKI